MDWIDESGVVTGRVRPITLLLFGILVTLFGGFLWLKSGSSGLNGYWILVAGLLIGVTGVVVEISHSRNGS